MLTIFTTPKPFRGLAGITQRNALENWLELGCRVIVFGGPEEIIIGEIGCHVHVREFAHSPFGAPLADDMFRKAEKLAGPGLLIYTNCDMLFTPDLIQTAHAAFDLFDKPALIIGQRWDVTIKRRLDTWDGSYFSDLQALVTTGTLHSPSGKDYFLFQSPLQMPMLPLRIGRACWDQYLVHFAADYGMTVVDATAVLTAIHQNHDYSHLAGGKDVAWTGEDAKENRRLAPVPTDKGRISEAHWRLEKLGGKYYARRKS